MKKVSEWARERETLKYVQKHHDRAVSPFVYRANVGLPLIDTTPHSEPPA